MRLVLLVLLLFIPEAVHSFLHSCELNRSILRQRSKLFLSNEDDTSSEKYTTLPRLYVGPPPTGNHVSLPVLTQDLRLDLDSDQAHYVTKVMRIDGKKKSRLRLFDGQSGEWLAQIQVTGTRNRVDVHATCLQQLQPQTVENGPWVIFAPLKKARVKQLLEKCTELGAGRFVAVQTERTDPGSLRDLIGSVDKLALQIVEASEQCERLTLPTLTSHHDKEESLVSLKDMLASWEEQTDRHLLICRERSATTVPVLEKLKGLGKVAFLIGPEGGWSADEEYLFQEWMQTSTMIHSVSLGSNVLRAETAAMTAVIAFGLAT